MAVVLARERFERTLDALVLTHPRTLASAICGLYNFLQRDDGAMGKLALLCIVVLKQWRPCRRSETCIALGYASR